jgi:hypothetical protein
MMYADVYVDEPLDKIVDDWDFLNEKVLPKFLGFRPVGHGVYGMRQILPEAPQSVEQQQQSGTGPIIAVKNRRHWEIGPKGVVEVKRTPLVAHVMLAGTPHHTEHVYGYWHINDMDEIYLPLPNPEGDPLGHYLVIMQTPRGEEGDSYAWYCEQCTTMLFERRHRTGQFGMQGLFKCSELAVREYNADPKLRTCPECGHLNPMGYCWNSAKDTPDERAARAIW